ncbi:MAG: helix-turn-helix transcriptional regulator [Clostridia bacterium]|nr:helix-turn-helix transcriptional regulator [Clostridia bacterium]
MNEQTALTEATYYTLLSLVTPRHGYGIMQKTEQMTGGRIRLAAGTLYGALNTLCDKGWVAPMPTAEDSRKKQYRLTERGRRVLEKEIERLRELIRSSEEVFKEEENND